MEILIPVLTLSFLGLVFGVGLAIAAKKFCVVSDPRMEEVLSLLPGANCGACGKAGCMGFVEGLISGECSVDKCVVSDSVHREAIAKILGVEAKQRIKAVAQLHCNGGKNRAKDKFVYTGIKDCIAANLVMGGQKACSYGCLEFGSCERTCPFGAITMNEEDLPVVNESKCTACGKCVAICPKRLFTLQLADKKYFTACASKDFGKGVMDACSVGCIACGNCVKACPVKAIKVINNLAAFDYKTCQDIGECLKVCPTHAIGRRG